MRGPVDELADDLRRGDTREEHLCDTYMYSAPRQHEETEKESEGARIDTEANRRRDKQTNKFNSVSLTPGIVKPIPKTSIVGYWYLLQQTKQSVKGGRTIESCGKF